MASLCKVQIAALQNEARHQRDVLRQHQELVDSQQTVLKIQFRRMADIQAELDLVKATLRLAAPGLAAALIGRSLTPLITKPAQRPVRAARGFVPMDFSSASTAKKH